MKNKIKNKIANIMNINALFIFNDVFSENKMTL